MTRNRILLTVLAGALALALAPADAAAQRRGRPSRGGGGGGRPVVVGAAGGLRSLLLRLSQLLRPVLLRLRRLVSLRLLRAVLSRAFTASGYSSARIQVTPKHAEVYVDGYMAGTVDDFDGFLQRLDVPPGEHELTLYLDGYRTIRQKVLFRPGATVKISQAMEPLPPGESNEPRPQADPEAATPRTRKGARHRESGNATTRPRSARWRFASSRATRRCSSTARSGPGPKAPDRCCSISVPVRTRSRCGNRASRAIGRRCGSAPARRWR